MSGIGASGLNRAPAADALQRKTGQNVGGTASTSGSDQVSLSTLTGRLQELSAHLEATGDASPAREAKLSELTATVESGNYKPDVEALSATLIDTMQEQKA